MLLSHGHTDELISPFCSDSVRQIERKKAGVLELMKRYWFVLFMVSALGCGSDPGTRFDETRQRLVSGDLKGIVGKWSFKDPDVGRFDVYVDANNQNASIAIESFHEIDQTHYEFENNIPLEGKVRCRYRLTADSLTINDGEFDDPSIFSLRYKVKTVKSIPDLYTSGNCGRFVSEANQRIWKEPIIQIRISNREGDPGLELLYPGNSWLRFTAGREIPRRITEKRIIQDSEPSTVIDIVPPQSPLPQEPTDPNEPVVDPKVPLEPPEYRDVTCLDYSGFFMSDFDFQSSTIVELRRDECKRVVFLVRPFEGPHFTRFVDGPALRSIEFSDTPYRSVTDHGRSEQVWLQRSFGHGSLNINRHVTDRETGRILSMETGIYTINRYGDLIQTWHVFAGEDSDDKTVDTETRTITYYRQYIEVPEDQR